jgi:hypothetical protein
MPKWLGTWAGSSITLAGSTRKGKDSGIGGAINEHELLVVDLALEGFDFL